MPPSSSGREGQTSPFLFICSFVPRPVCFPTQHRLCLLVLFFFYNGEGERPRTPQKEGRRRKNVSVNNLSYLLFFDRSFLFQPFIFLYPFSLFSALCQLSCLFSSCSIFFLPFLLFCTFPFLFISTFLLPFFACFLPFFSPFYPFSIFSNLSFFFSTFFLPLLHCLPLSTSPSFLPSFLHRESDGSFRSSIIRPRFNHFHTQHHSALFLCNYLCVLGFLLLSFYPYIFFYC